MWLCHVNFLILACDNIDIFNSFVKDTLNQHLKEISVYGGNVALRYSHEKKKAKIHFKLL